MQHQDSSSQATANNPSNKSPKSINPKLKIMGFAVIGLGIVAAYNLLFSSPDSSLASPDNQTRVSRNQQSTSKSSTSQSEQATIQTPQANNQLNQGLVSPEQLKQWWQDSNNFIAQRAYAISQGLDIGLPENYVTKYTYRNAQQLFVSNDLIQYLPPTSQTNNLAFLQSMIDLQKPANNADQSPEYTEQLTYHYQIYTALICIRADNHKEWLDRLNLHPQEFKQTIREQSYTPCTPWSNVVPVTNNEKINQLSNYIASWAIVSYLEMDSVGNRDKLALWRKLLNLTPEQEIYSQTKVSFQEYIHQYNQIANTNLLINDQLVNPYAASHSPAEVLYHQINYYNPQAQLATIDNYNISLMTGKSVGLGQLLGINSSKQISETNYQQLVQIASDYMITKGKISNQQAEYARDLLVTLKHNLPLELDHLRANQAGYYPALFTLTNEGLVMDLMIDDQQQPIDGVDKLVLSYQGLKEVFPNMIKINK